MPPVLYLIDGHALAYRTYYAITRGSTGSFATRSGEPTAGVFGFTSVLLFPDRIVLVLLPSLFS